MIGNRTDARIAWDRMHGNGILPEGWVRLGSGCYRTAYLSPEGIVYKVQHYSDFGSDAKGFPLPDCNEAEALFWETYKDTELPEGFRITPCHLWGKRVLAMPRITSPHGYWTDQWVPAMLAARKWLADRDVYDTGGDNWLLDESGILWMVDYAQ